MERRCAPTVSIYKRLDVTLARCSACSRISNPIGKSGLHLSRLRSSITRTILRTLPTCKHWRKRSFRCVRRRGHASSSGWTTLWRNAGSRCSKPIAAAVTTSRISTFRTFGARQFCRWILIQRCPTMRDELPSPVGLEGHCCHRPQSSPGWVRRLTPRTFSLPRSWGSLFAEALPRPFPSLDVPQLPSLAKLSIAACSCDPPRLGKTFRKNLDDLLSPNLSQATKLAAVAEITRFINGSLTGMFKPPAPAYSYDIARAARNLGDGPLSPQRLGAEPLGTDEAAGSAHHHLQGRKSHV